MIEHKIGKFELKTHIKKVAISKKEFDRINKLLSIKNLEELSDKKLEKLGAEKYTSALIFSVVFDDGAELDWYLCSGSINYYDNVIFHYADKRLYADALDCVFKLDNIEITTVTDDYIVKLVKE